MPLFPPLPFSLSLSLLSCHSDIFGLVAQAIVAVLRRSLLLLLLLRRRSEVLLNSVMFVGLQRHPEQSQPLQRLGGSRTTRTGQLPRPERSRKRKNLNKVPEGDSSSLVTLMEVHVRGVIMSQSPFHIDPVMREKRSKVTEFR